MQVENIIKVKLKVGDTVQIEHRSVDERKKIKATVSCCTIHNGKGVAVFLDTENKVYTWKPSSDPHGEVVQIDGSRPDILISPYVMVFCTKKSKYIPVYSKTAEYTYCEKVCETHEWSEPLPPHGDRICLDCKKVVNDQFQ